MKILRPILAGALLAAALFILPFLLLRMVMFALVVGLLFRLLARGMRRRAFARFRAGGNFGYRPKTAYADHIRSLSEEEYQHYKRQSSF